MDRLQQTIRDIAAPLVDEAGAFLVDLAIQQGRKRKIVHIYADTDAGINIDQCADISRRIAKVVEEKNVIDGSYDLLVSSPGIDRPLKLLRQYAKNVGRKYRVRLRRENTEETFEAALEAVENETITFRLADESLKPVAFAEILESKEILPW